MSAARPNTPELWRSHLPRPAADAHKYDRGHAVILGAERYTGATRLAAEACSRIGAGLVTVQTEHQGQVYKQTLPADIMVNDRAYEAINRPTSLLAGPGGCSDAQAETVALAAATMDLVLDADAIRLLPNLSPKSCVITPHEGEYVRYFGDLPTDRAAHVLERAQSHGVITVLKGPETLIAAPDGRLVLNTVASPYLAKAGTGDVLAGLITGLVAQSMPAFEAACAAVWIHGKAGQHIGPGLIPQDIIAELPALLRELLA